MGLYLQQLPPAAEHAASWDATWRAQHRRVAQRACCTCQPAGVMFSHRGRSGGVELYTI